MTDRADIRHLAAERLQAFLDGALPDREVVAVREHVESCQRCRADLEAWRLLFGELSELGRLEPSPALREGVLRGVRTAADVRLDAALESLGRLDPSPGFAARVLQGLRAREHAASVRVGDAEVEALLAGLGHYEPGPAFAARVMEGWRAESAEHAALEQEVDALLAGVGHFEPSPAMAARVMAQVRVGALARRRRANPLAVAARSAVDAVRAAARALGSVVPKSRKAWAILGGVAVTPASIVALVAWTVFSNPLATPGNLLQFAWWQVSGTVAGAGAAIGEFVVASPVLAQAYTVVEFMAATPVVAVAGALSFALLSCGALWVLYKNLIPTRSVEPRYARAAV